MGLLYNRPDDHVAYLMECLDRVKSLPGRERSVFWDTFLPSERRPSRLEKIDNPPTPDLTNNPTTDASNVQQVATTSNESNTSKDVTVPTSNEDVVENEKSVETEPSTAGDTKADDKPQRKQLQTRVSVTLRSLSPFEDEVPQEGGDSEVVENTQVQASVSDEQEVFADQATLAIIKGSLENLPAMPRNSVRIFLSSTFSGELIVLKIATELDLVYNRYIHFMTIHC